MAHQAFQQCRLFSSQLDDTSGATRFVPHQVEREVAYRELEGLIKTAFAAAEQGVDARQQFLHGERLGQVVIGPHIETRHTVLDRATCCEHQHRRQNTLSTHLATDLEPIESGQHHVKNHYIISIAQGKVQPGMPVVREINGVALFQQDAPQQKRKALLVLYHKNMHCSIPFFLM